ncbi:hypothetical protein A628_00091 [Salmonella enterica subsp. enterica serovar Cubana str. 76814]|uniref:Uncharacterized protein n=1 Tax=Salmonella enterica subsp. enterica serovar Cubana str. 76814 TaxID=1192560 RepID=V7IVE5_SALET|nr:hypothetical protein A628_00091 [Salmonella enterica subsp. enterica serovar Cubana str. 76814]
MVNIQCDGKAKHTFQITYYKIFHVRCEYLSVRYSSAYNYIKKYFFDDYS